MLGDLPALRKAAHGYRAAASAVGLTWPAADAPSGVRPPPDLVHRLFGVDRVAEQVAWLQPRGWHGQRLLTNGGELLPWPADGEALDTLSLSVSDGTRSGLDLLQAGAPDLDPLAFPVSVAHHPLLRARQAACRVDMSCVDRGFERMEELLDEIATVRASLGV
ncbi:hypothetical protein ACLGIH_32880 [Streptomyces sp. HMX87]|uniref:hypothetical protein n=1 Tax=Streptomyces sp. HMX87 TaxID=3390849 RepID=UPI003A8B266D